MIFVITFLLVACIVLAFLWRHTAESLDIANADYKSLEASNLKLCDSLNVARKERNEALAELAGVTGKWRDCSRQLALSNADADLLARIVTDYLKICDETAVFIKDENAPIMSEERAALSNHEKLVQERSNEPSRS